MIDVLIAILSSCAMIILNHHYQSECFGRKCCDIKDTENSTLTERIAEQQFYTMLNEPSTSLPN